MARDFNSIQSGKDNLDPNKSSELDLNTVELVVKNLRDYYNLDFSNYAQASLTRRIKHLITIFGLSDANELILKIKNEPDFKISLVHEITVGATEMFRDPIFWDSLKTDILSKVKTEKEILNIWVSGCSTGEEIFSLSIALKETGLFDKTIILASDLDPLVIDIARKGFYLNPGFVKNSENYIKSKGSKTLDYYCKKGGLGYQMDLSLLEHVTFKHNDLIREQIEDKFDIILCRNVLIYFNQELQNSVLKKLRHNLRSNAFLCLGVKESISWLEESNQFDPLKRLEKIYQLKSNGVNA